MVNTSLARPEQESTTRTERGLELYRSRWADIRFERGSWMVPSASDETTTYAVRLGPVPSCECADHAYRGARCLHITAATIAHAKSTVCSCCGSRVHRCFATEVAEDDALLSWFPGDLICGDCVNAGFWV